MNLRDEVIKLKKRCYDCKDCPLGRKEVDGLDPHVYSSGYVKSKIFFVAEAPGANEVIEKIPLVGRSGKFYNEKILGIAGIKREKVFTTNSVMCRPSKNRTPLPVEIDTCRQHLDAQICLLKPSLLIPMGNVALNTCCGITGIVKNRGILRWSREWSNGTKIPVFPLFHPSYCLRGSGLKVMEEDAKKIGELYKILEDGLEIPIQMEQ